MVAMFIWLQSLKSLWKSDFRVLLDPSIRRPAVQQQAGKASWSLPCSFGFRILKACVRVTSEPWPFHCDLLCINKLGRFHGHACIWLQSLEGLSKSDFRVLTLPLQSAVQQQAGKVSWSAMFIWHQSLKGLCKSDFRVLTLPLRPAVQKQAGKVSWSLPCLFDIRVLKACVRVTSESWPFHCDLLCRNKLGRFHGHCHVYLTSES